jgi:hypothetical protein
VGVRTCGICTLNFAAHVSKTETWVLGPTSHFQLKKGEAVWWRVEIGAVKEEWLVCLPILLVADVFTMDDQIGVWVSFEIGRRFELPKILVHSSFKKKILVHRRRWPLQAAYNFRFFFLFLYHPKKNRPIPTQQQLG